MLCVLLVGRRKIEKNREVARDFFPGSEAGYILLAVLGRYNLRLI
jgi:hypothetical protein